MSAPVIMFLLIIITVVMTLLIILRSNNLAAKENQAAAMNRINIKIGESTAVTFRQLVNDQLEIEVLENGEKKTFSTESPASDTPSIPPVDEGSIFNSPEAEEEMIRIRELAFSTVGNAEGRSSSIKARIAEMVNMEATARAKMIMETKQKEKEEADKEKGDSGSDTENASGGGQNKSLKPEPKNKTENKESQSLAESFFGSEVETPSNTSVPNSQIEQEQQAAYVRTEAEKIADDEFSSFFAGQEEQIEDQKNFLKKHPHLNYQNRNN